MADKKNIHIVGIDPYLIDFKSPEFAAVPDLTAEKVEASIKGSVNQLNETGYNAELCWTDFGQTAKQVVKAHLESRKFDGVVIGAVIRVVPGNFQLFENLINVIRETAPQATISFNTNPKDTTDAVQRWN